jgi:hypothetical protein
MASDHAATQSTGNLPAAVPAELAIAEARQRAGDAATSSRLQGIEGGPSPHSPIGEGFRISLPDVSAVSGGLLSRAAAAREFAVRWRRHAPIAAAAAVSLVSACSLLWGLNGTRPAAEPPGMSAVLDDFAMSEVEGAEPLAASPRPPADIPAAPAQHQASHESQRGVRTAAFEPPQAPPVRGAWLSGTIIEQESQPETRRARK